MTFRQYDPAIGRFNGMDRLAELTYSLTPYRFAPAGASVSLVPYKENQQNKTVI